MKVDKRRNADGDKAYAITKLWDTHHEILRLLALGMKGKAIADRLNVSPQTVSNVRNSPEGRRLLSLLHARRDTSVIGIQQRIHELLPKAVDTMEEAMEEADWPVRKAAAKDLLEMGGFKAIEKKVSVSHLTRDDIDGIKKMARDMNLSAEEAEVVEEEETK